MESRQENLKIGVSHSLFLSSINGGKFVKSLTSKLKKKLQPSTSGAICRLPFCLNFFSIPFLHPQLSQTQLVTYSILSLSLSLSSSTCFHGREGEHRFWVARNLGDRVSPTGEHLGAPCGEHGTDHERRGKFWLDSDGDDDDN